jgi:hypothetical protein
VALGDVPTLQGALRSAGRHVPEAAPGRVQLAELDERPLREVPEGTGCRKAGLRLWVPSRLPGLNELLSSKSTRHGNWSAYNDVKQRWFGQIKLLARSKDIRAVGPGYFSFLFVEPDKRRDPDNVAAGGIKILLDALVGAEVLAGDGWQHILGFVSYWQVGDKPGCLIQWDERQTWSKPAMQGALEKELKT